MVISYKSSGVNIAESDTFIKSIKPLVKKTFSKNVLQGIGNFGAFYSLDVKKYKSPVLVSSVDGVGTKLKLALLMDNLETIGEDLVNHCVNDIAVCGAKPLYFLDYYATGKLRSSESLTVFKGLVKGCLANKVSLIGGETAEMPGLYAKNDFDLAGCIVGIAEKSKIINYNKVQKDDVLIGIESNGTHTNGYSLIRKIFGTKKKLNEYYPELRNKIGNEFLRPHKSYFPIIQNALANFRVKSISHITGGGIEGNTSRVIPKDRLLAIDWNSWERPPLFKIIQKKGSVPEADMRRTFNLGIGIIFIVSKRDAGKFARYLDKKEKYHVIGEIK